MGERVPLNTRETRLQLNRVNSCNRCSQNGCSSLDGGSASSITLALVQEVQKKTTTKKRKNGETLKFFLADVHSPGERRFAVSATVSSSGSPPSPGPLNPASETVPSRSLVGDQTSTLLLPIDPLEPVASLTAHLADLAAALVSVTVIISSKYIPVPPPSPRCAHNYVAAWPQVFPPELQNPSSHIKR